MVITPRSRAPGAAGTPVPPGSGCGRDLGIAIHDGGPAAGRGDARVDGGPAGPVPLKVAVLKLHPGLAVRLAGEPDLELTGVRGVGVEVPGLVVRVDLPGHDDPVRWVAGEHLAPVALAAVHAALVVAAPGTWLEHDVGKIGFPEVVPVRPPAEVTLGEQAERPLRGQWHGHRTADWRERPSGCGLLGHGCSCRSPSVAAAAAAAASWNEASACPHIWSR